MCKKTLAGVVSGLVLAAGSAQAAQVSVTGAANLAPTGSASVLGAGSNGVFNTTSQAFSASGSYLSVAGVVRARSTVRDLGGGVLEQAMDLSWHELRVVTCAAVDVAFTVTLTQQFAIAPVFVGQMASFNSFTSDTSVDFTAANQMASWSRTRSDDGPVSDVTIARTRTSTGAQTALFDGESGFGSPSATMASVYTMTMTLNFLLRPNGQLMTFVDCSGPTDATLVMVPLPAGGWAGLGGLAMLGAVAVKRRRTMAA